MRNVSALDKAREFRGAIWLEEIFPSNWRRVIILTSFFVVLVSGVAYSFDAFGLLMLEPLLPFFVLFGGLALLVGIWTISFHTFFLFYRLASPESHQPEQGNNNAQAINLISYPIAYILLDAEISEDLTSGFLLSSWGRLVLLRCGIKQTEQLDFLKSRQQTTSLDLAEEVLNKKGILTFDSLLSELLSADDELKNFLLDHGVSTETFSSAVRWVAGQEKRSKQARRFWSRGRLKDITPIGSDFSYGKAYTLEKFSRSLSDQSVFVGAFDTGAVFQEDIKQTLNLLSRRRNNNALLIGEAASGVADIVSEISDRIADGRTADNLAGRHIYVLNTQAITTIAKSKQQLQRLLEKLFNEAANAGNVLLVIEDFPYFIEEAAQFGVNLVSFLEPFFEYQALPFLLTASPSSYHQKLEGNSEIMSQLGVVSVHKVDDDTTMRLLMEIAISSEGQALCTVGGLQAVVEGARRLLTYDEMPHAAVDLLLEILSVKTSGFVDELYVHQYLSDKTGVPTGRVSEDERVVLQTLESELNERIVGQNEATKAVAAALRRNRAGVENKDRPIGTFLFLGPTGVGKTETAKTLARIYFDGEESMRRLDMSEYSDVRSASELSGDSGSAGRLANMVREQPYGLLLLDEFEKAHTQVHDLFLQILDEGSFTDSRGRVVNLENMIIIATSNAVAQKIFSLVEAGDDLSARQDQIIDQLIETNTFRPELLNRFDQIVLYHPLNQRQLESVTSLLLEELTQRIQKQGYQLTIAPDVTGFIVESAYDPKFGARAIRREIQNNAETVIADKIIDQGLQPGDEIKLTVTDLKEADMEN